MLLQDHLKLLKNPRPFSSGFLTLEGSILVAQSLAQGGFKAKADPQWGKKMTIPNA